MDAGRPEGAGFLEAVAGGVGVAADEVVDGAVGVGVDEELRARGDVGGEGVVVGELVGGRGEGDLARTVGDRGDGRRGGGLREAEVGVAGEDGFEVEGRRGVEGAGEVEVGGGLAELGDGR